MTFFHFCNCLALAYAPYFIVYKYSALSEYSNIWRYAQAALCYLMTQFLKMLTLATFFPVSESVDFDITYETIKSCVDIIDILGLHFTISYMLTGKGEVKLLTAGLGWAAAHSLLTNAVVLVVGARHTGFSWRYIQTAFESNIDLVFYLCLATLVWVYNRQDQPTILRRLGSLLLLFCIVHSLVFQALFYKFGLRSWQLLGAKAGLTAILALLTLVVYSGVGSKSTGGQQQSTTATGMAKTQID